MLRVLEIAGVFFYSVCVCSHKYVCDHTEACKRWWLVPFHPVLDSSPCSPPRGRSVDSVAERGRGINGPSPPVELVIAPDKSPKPRRAQRNRKRVQMWVGKVRLLQKRGFCAHVCSFCVHLFHGCVGEKKKKKNHHRCPWERSIKSLLYD